MLKEVRGCHCQCEGGGLVVRGCHCRCKGEVITVKFYCGY